MQALMELKNVSKVYSRGLMSHESVTALSDFSLKIYEDKPTILTVAGESGSGKTTLAMLLLGFIQPTQGKILYRGKDINRLKGNDHVVFRREVQAVFQDPFAIFNPFYKVDHLLTVPIKKFNLAKNKKEVREKINQALTTVGLHPDDILGRFPHQISGGQRQRINIARALLLRPKVLIADEPVSMVDASLRANILETLSRLQKDYGVTILYITHDLTTAYHIAKSIVVFYRGSVMEAGEVDKVIKSPQHPYTQLLIDSIPWPDLQQRWGKTEIQHEKTNIGEYRQGCKFYSRCPSGMEKCKVRPHLIQVQEHQVVTCYLYDEGNAPVPPEEITSLLPV